MLGLFLLLHLPHSSLPGSFKQILLGFLLLAQGAARSRGLESQESFCKAQKCLGV